MSLILNVPLNSVSFGQVGFGLLDEARKQNLDTKFLPISHVDLSTITVDEDFKKWVELAQVNALENISKDDSEIRIWHLFEGYTRHSNKSKLISFYELDSPTRIELNIAKNTDLYFTSKYTCEVFKEKGANANFVPLAFDKKHFYKTDKTYYKDGRIVFGVLGKFENRKHHQKMIKAWLKKFGNDKRYMLQCAVYNPFFEKQMNENIFRSLLEGKNYFNINFIPWIQTNRMYNDFLNSNNIVLGMSGGEGWGLPEFHSVGIGKHAVILNAHGYKEWANDENCVMINPLKKIPAYDGLFFKEGQPFNQGNIFDWDEDDFISGCEQAIQRVVSNTVNSDGLKLQTEFTYKKTLDALL